MDEARLTMVRSWWCMVGYVLDACESESTYAAVVDWHEACSFLQMGSAACFKVPDCRRDGHEEEYVN